MLTTSYQVWPLQPFFSTCWGEKLPKCICHVWYQRYPGRQKMLQSLKDKESNFPTACPLFSLSGNKAFKCFLFSDPLWFPSSLHQISWHAISEWETGSSSMLNSIQAVRLNAEKHTSAPIRPTTVIRNVMGNIDRRQTKRRMRSEKFMANISL